MEKEIIELTTDGGLKLKQFVVEDSEIIFDLINRNREHLSQYSDRTASKYKTLQDVEKSINYPVNPKKNRLGIWKNNIFIGTINLKPNEEDNSIGIIGYYLGSEFIGNGFMRDSVKRIIDYGFNEKSYLRLEAEIDEPNIRSVNVLEGVGFNKYKSKPLEGFEFNRIFYFLDKK